MTAPKTTSIERRNIADRLEAGEDPHTLAAAYGVHVKTIWVYTREVRRFTPKPTRREPIRETAWMVDGKCVASSGRYTGFTELPIGEQRETCRGCPVRTECAIYGASIPVGDHNDAVVYGALAPAERNELRKILQKAKHPTHEAIKIAERRHMADRRTV